MQGLKDFVPTDSKVRYIQALLGCGFHTLDCGSFVSAPMVPQMRDTQEVLDRLDMSGTTTRLMVVCANLKGTEKAAAHPKVTYVGYPLSACETFQRKNTNRSIAQALEDIGNVQRICSSNGKELVTFISMGFGNPYGEDFSPEIVERLVDRVVAGGCRIVSLADTVGVSEPGIITTLFSTIIPKHPNVTVGAHFHSGAVESREKIKAALESGCRRLDHAIGGMGGCPFAKSTLVGNVSTETVLSTIQELGYHHQVDLDALAKCQAIRHDVFGVGVKELLLANVMNDEKAFVEICTRHFKKADVSGTGHLTREGFTEAVRKVFSDLGEEPPLAERIMAKFTEIDLSEDGRITLDEYILGARRFLKKRLAKLMAAAH